MKNLNSAARGILAGCLSFILLACSGDPQPGVEPTAAAQPEAAAVIPDSSAASPERQAFFGDLHVHSSWSLDGYIFGNSNDPRAAYRYARGEAVPLADTDSMRQRDRPLDFAAVTDHAETLGYFRRCLDDEQSEVWGAEACRMLRARDLRLYFKGFKNLAMNPPQHLAEICSSNELCRQAAVSPWLQLGEIANELNAPGKFTTFKAYEYTGNLPRGGMLHRNVIFAGDSVPPEAMSAFDLATARELWRWLDESCSGDCDVITIPHNSNLAWGYSFLDRNVDGSEWTLEDQQLRARMDRLAEIYQAKGNSECHTGIGTQDEFCNFELLLEACAEGEELGCMRDSSFVRNGLKAGLQLQGKLGFNPHQYGIIASTDTHNGTPGDTREVAYAGHNSGESTLEKRLTGGHRAKEGRGAVNYNPGGLAGAWAEENTRDSLFAAFKRRETFGTSGNHISIRLFAGWDYSGDLYTQADAIEVAYREGVPMGATLNSAADVQAPALLVWASQDPQAAPLQRLQIIKGWTDSQGQTFEQTFDVACSDGLKPDPASHRCPDNGATVNLGDCSLVGGKGDAQLATVWRDPDFDPAQQAFYYARVLENPSCRWSSYDLINSGGQIEVPDSISRTIQERAWSSPVWFKPKESTSS